MYRWKFFGFSINYNHSLKVFCEPWSLTIIFRSPKNEPRSPYDRKWLGDQGSLSIHPISEKRDGENTNTWKKVEKNRWKKTHNVTFFIYHTTYIPLNNNTYNIITPHCAEKFCSTRFTKKRRKNCTRVKMNFIEQLSVILF